MLVFCNKNADISKTTGALVPKGILTYAPNFNNPAKP